MHAKTLLALALTLPVIACAGSARTIELPGGGPTAEERQTERPAQGRTWVERALGADSSPNVGPCPLMGVLAEASRQVSFADPSREAMANVDYTAEMRGVRGLCRYVESDPITMNMTIDMAFGRGPAATADTHTYRYWVAVARRGRAPIAKEYFDVTVRFPRGEQVVTTTESIERIVIPRANADISGENFEVLVGFELTDAQLAFNRDGKRFVMGAGRGG